MESQATAIDFSEYRDAPKTSPGSGNIPEIKNKNGVYIAVIVVSFTVTVILYAILFKNQSPGKPNINPLPAVENWQDKQTAP